MCRFDIVQELHSIRGYRVVKPQWNRFLPDLEIKKTNAGGDREGVLKLLKRYFKVKGLSMDWTLVEQFSTLELVHMMATIIPLEPIEKQAILEAEALPDRAKALCSALEFGLRASSGFRKQ